MIRAVIFDMDGVLIDSEPVYQKYMYDRFVVHYPWITMEEMSYMAGMSGPETKSYLARLMRQELSDPVFREELEEIYHGCKVYYPDILNPYVAETLKELKEMGLQIALASSSSTENIAQVLSECGLTDYFDMTISGDEFRRSKPDPEIYQYTMGRLGRSPEECLVVEDSTYGIEAGVAAGATVAAVRDERFPFDQSRAAYHIDSLAELPGILREVNAGNQEE